MILRFAVLPFLAILLVVEIAGGVLRAPFLSWNEIRLCRSMALLRGLPIYPGRDALGPVIGTLHTLPHETEKFGVFELAESKSFEKVFGGVEALPRIVEQSGQVDRCKFGQAFVRLIP